jgi:hypothetical protein
MLRARYMPARVAGGSHDLLHSKRDAHELRFPATLGHEPEVEPTLLKFNPASDVSARGTLDRDPLVGNVRLAPDT